MGSSSQGGATESKTKFTALIPLLASAVEKAGLYEDIPFKTSQQFIRSNGAAFNHSKVFSAEDALELLNDPTQSDIFVIDYSNYMNELSNYLVVLEQRLFSEGLHEIGGKPTAQQVSGYLNAVLEGSGLDDSVLSTIADSVVGGMQKSSLLLSLWNEKKFNISSREFGRKEGVELLNSFWNDNWLTSARNGVHFRDLFSDEDGFALDLASKGGGNIFERLQQLLQYQLLRFQRDWGLTSDAAEKINDMISLSIARTSKASTLTSNQIGTIAAALCVRSFEGEDLLFGGDATEAHRKRQWH